MTRDEIIDLLKKLPSERFKLGLVELGLIRDIMVKDDTVSLTVVSLGDEQELSGWKEAATREITKQNLKPHIRTRLITDFEKTELQKKLNPSSRSGEAGQPSGATSGQTMKTGQQQAHFKPGDQSSLMSDPNVTFVAIASGKGGVGKSTVTVNLAAALARRGKRVGIMDCDIYGFSVPDMMGIEDRPGMADGNKITPVERFGVKVISMGFFVEDNAPIIWRGPMLGKMLRNFFVEVEWGELDYLLLDLPPGTGDIALDVHQMLPQCKEIIVTTPHATASFVAARAGAMALRTNHEVIGVIENMAFYENSNGVKDYVFGKGGGAKLAQELNTELLAQIPLGAPDNHPSEADYSPSVYKEDSVVGRIYLELANNLV
jgi:ATP-binding protein involved in chromosome partitioning